MSTTHPIFGVYETPYGAYPFDQIDTADYRTAFAEAINEKRIELDRIIHSSEPPTFANTILALEQAGSKLEQVSGIFFNLLHAECSEELMAISEDLVPELSELSTYALLSKPLFERIRTVYEMRNTIGLDEEEMRLLEQCYEGYAEQGALLSEADKNRLRELSIELSHATLAFGQNNLRDQKRYRLHLTNQDDVAGIPDSLLIRAREQAQREGYTDGGWVFDLTAPSYIPFMQHCRHSHLRKSMYMAKMRIGMQGDEYDNRHLIRQIVNGRLEEAQLLGFPTFAHWALHRRMIANPEAVYELLDQLLEAYRPRAIQELDLIRSYAWQHGHQGSLEHWDWSYWAEQYKQTHYQLDDEMLRPYFELGRVTEAIFDLATRLYGLRFALRQDIPVYHPEVKTYEVLREDGSFLGLLYLDFFPRDGKRSGAWMSNLQEQYHLPNGRDHRPHIILVMNFTPPTIEQPSLLTAGEVHTFLHEFGHALHGLLSECRFASLSGTGVARDFVELPSQIMENWLSEREWLTTFAYHYKTQAPLPEEYVNRMEAARHFLVGYTCCRQLSFGYLDMAWHSITQPIGEDEDLKMLEERSWQQALILPSTPSDTMMSTSFGHIFSGGYAAGYYGYKWAEVLDADAFSLFRSGDIFSRSVAERFRREILSQGDRRDAMELYVAFRGQRPTIDALLRRDGIQS